MSQLNAICRSILIALASASPVLAQQATSGDLPILPGGGAPTIDGVVNEPGSGSTEWDNAFKTVSRTGGACLEYFPDVDSGTASPDPSDVSASRPVTLYTKRDATKLYFGFIIPDQTIPGASVGDRIILVFDPTKTGGTAPKTSDRKLDFRTQRNATADSKRWYEGSGTDWGSGPVETWTTTTPSATRGITVAAVTSGSGSTLQYSVEISIPLTALWATPPSPLNDIGFSFAIINDLNMVFGSDTILTGLPWPDAFDTTPNPLDLDSTQPYINYGGSGSYLPAPWDAPSNWGTAFLTSIGETLFFENASVAWLNDSLKATFCNVSKTVNATTLTPSHPDWYFYQDVSPGPCTLRLRSLVKRSGGTFPIQRQVLFLWADHGANPQFWRYVGFAPAMTFQPGSNVVTCDPVDFNVSGIHLTQHPCVKAFILPVQLNKPGYDLAFFQGIGTGTSPNYTLVNNFVAAYQLNPTRHIAQMNLNKVMTPLTTCPGCVARGPAGSGATNAMVGEQPGEAPAREPLPSGAPFITIDVASNASASALNTSLPFAFVRPHGGVRKMISVPHLVRERKLDLPFNVSNSLDAKRQVWAHYRVQLPGGLPAFEFNLPPLARILDPGEVTGIVARIGDGSGSGSGSGGLAASLHVGAAVPHGTFGNFKKSGPMGTLDLEYGLTPSLSADLLIGAARFAGKSGAGDTSLYHASLNAKFYFLQGDWRPFVNAGGGIYSAHPGDNESGFNVGAGLRFDLNPRLGLEASYSFHDVIQSGTDATFSGIQLGAVFKF